MSAPDETIYFGGVNRPFPLKAMTPLQEVAIQFLPFARATVMAKLTPEGIPYLAMMLGMDVKEAGEIPVYSMVNRIAFLFAKDFIATSQLP